MDITPKVLADVLKSQVGLVNTNSSISIRLLKFSAWSYGGPFINLSCKDLHISGDTNDHLKLVEDNQAKNRFANVHYVWPISQQQAAFSGEDLELLVQIGTKSSDTGTWRAHILWTFRVVTAPNLQEAAMMSQLSRTSAFRHLQAQIDNLTHHVVQQRPTTSQDVQPASQDAQPTLDLEKRVQELELLLSKVVLLPQD
jgi:hypothetical protein